MMLGESFKVENSDDDGQTQPLDGSCNSGGVLASALLAQIELLLLLCNSVIDYYLRD